MSKEAPQRPPEGFTGLWRTTSPIDESYHETEYRDGAPNGVFRYCLASGAVVREGVKRNGLIHGTVVIRDADGAELDRCEFEDGTGMMRIYTTAGRVGWEVPFLNGEVHGVKRQFSQNQPIQELEYDHCQLHGQIRYLRGGEVVRVEEYRHGQKVE